VPTNRSAYEFARGDRTGVLITRMAFAVKTWSNAAVNLQSRSRIKNLNRPAEAIARSITDLEAQADALARIAETLARAGETRFAYRMAAATCAIGRWTTAAPPVLLLAPSAYPEPASASAAGTARED
jgi:hypothetical protein